MSRVDWRRAEKIWAARAGVIAVWAFGSAQRGEITAGSDLDIGVLFESPPSLDERASLRADLQQALQVDEIDLVVLNEASPVLRFEAISGRPVFCRDRGRRAEFASLTAREYEDEMAMLQQALRME